MCRRVPGRYLGSNDLILVLLSPTEQAQRALHSQPSPKAQRTTPIDFFVIFFVFFGRHVGGSKNRTWQFHPKKIENFDCASSVHYCGVLE